MTKKTTCKWTIEKDEYDEYMYHNTECSHEICFESEGPKENNYKYCPFCGLTIEE